MLNKDCERELAYIVKISSITDIIGSDNCECANVLGWTVLVHKNEFKANDYAVFFEPDSLVDISKPEFDFLSTKHGKIKVQKYTFGGKGSFISQGLLMPVTAFGWEVKAKESAGMRIDGTTYTPGELYVSTPFGDLWEYSFLTKQLNVTYNVPEDNARKASAGDKLQTIKGRHPKFFRNPVVKKLMRYEWFRKFVPIIFKPAVNAKQWPVGRFPGVNKTDQERCENIPNICKDKSEYIRTQKCDGSSGTFILERKSKNKFEFYVCSRNVRMVKPDQKCFYDDKNYYWEVAIKYDIEAKMKDFLLSHPDLSFVCWQGEICAPGIQGNPHGLTSTHLFCFHMTDNIGRYDIREAAKIWESYNMEVVPIDSELYILPDDFEEFKKSADGTYNAKVCEGKTTQRREGYVYYKVSDPTCSFKNVSREYLLSK